LWKKGKLVGLFNIPFENEEIFKQCVDFAMESDPSEIIVSKMEFNGRQNAIEILQQTNKLILTKVEVCLF
jgi:hypothetical protein